MSDNTPDFFPETVQNPQELRNLALKWQLMALAAQSKAIRVISEEHQNQSEHHAPDSLYERARDFVAGAQRVAAEADSQPVETTLEAIRSLRAVSDQLKSDAQSFQRNGQWTAKFRLSSTLSILAEGCLPKKEAEALEPDAQELARSASQRCANAECEQDETFVLQLRAICDLTMEMLLVAAGNNADSN